MSAVFQHKPDEKQNITKSVLLAELNRRPNPTSAAVHLGVCHATIYRLIKLYRIRKVAVWK